MKTMDYADAADDALVQAMADDPRIVYMGEDVHALRLSLFCRFGQERVLSTPISESAFTGAAVTAAMAGLRPVIEFYIIDFIAVAMDALLNHAAKVAAFSDGRWTAPLVIRASCGGGYGDGGQHEQSLWGWLAHIPGLAVVAPSTPADAGGLILAALAYDGPVIFLEHKLLSRNWLDFMGGASRKTVEFDVPADGACGLVPKRWEALPVGQAITRREGRDLTIATVSLGVHRALEAAAILEAQGISAGVIDLRWIWPLDEQALCQAVSLTGRLLVVDEDYRRFGLSGELAAVLLENGIQARYGRVCTEETIPYAREKEDQVLPGVPRILQAAQELLAY
jgi:pyruvate dehydrogenase E1 component beta subunit